MKGQSRTKKRSAYKAEEDYIEKISADGDIDLEFPMVYVEGGTFKMGATPEQKGFAYVEEWPAHKVTLSSYHIGKYPITQAQYRAVMGENPSYFQGEELEKRVALRKELGKNIQKWMTESDKFPVESITWYQAQEFCKKLSEKTGKRYIK